MEVLRKYMKGLANPDCPVVLSITDTRAHVATGSAIHRNNTREVKRVESIDIYVRAREIYYRARRHKPVRAASIF